jgi:hypothetical protein
MRPSRIPLSILLILGICAFIPISAQTRATNQRIAIAVSGIFDGKGAEEEQERVFPHHLIALAAEKRGQSSGIHRAIAARSISFQDANALARPLPSASNLGPNSSSAMKKISSRCMG